MARQNGARLDSCCARHLQEVGKGAAHFKRCRARRPRSVAFRSRVAERGRQKRGFSTAARPLKALSRAGAWHSFAPEAAQRNGAVGENRTHDLSLTKGLRYHYATTATVVLRHRSAEPLTQNCEAKGGKGALL